MSSSSSTTSPAAALTVSPIRDPVSLMVASNLLSCTKLIRWSHCGQQFLIRVADLARSYPYRKAEHQWPSMYDEWESLPVMAAVWHMQEEQITQTAAAAASSSASSSVRLVGAWCAGRQIMYYHLVEYKAAMEALVRIVGKGRPRAQKLAFLGSVDYFRPFECKLCDGEPANKFNFMALEQLTAKEIIQGTIEGAAAANPSSATSPGATVVAAAAAPSSATASSKVPRASAVAASNSSSSIATPPRKLPHRLVTVHCLHRALGCTKQIESMNGVEECYRAMDEHESQQCEYREVECPRCKGKMQSRRQEVHNTSECTERIIVCSSCNESLPVNQLLQHRYSASPNPHTPPCRGFVECCYKCIGEQYRGYFRKNEIDSHQPECGKGIIACVGKYCQEMKPHKIKRREYMNHLLKGMELENALLRLANVTTSEEAEEEDEEVEEKNNADFEETNNAPKTVAQAASTVPPPAAASGSSAVSSLCTVSSSTSTSPPAIRSTSNVVSGALPASTKTYLVAVRIPTRSTAAPQATTPSTTTMTSAITVPSSPAAAAALAVSSPTAINSSANNSKKRTASEMNTTKIKLEDDSKDDDSTASSSESDTNKKVKLEHPTTTAPSAFAAVALPACSNDTTMKHEDTASEA